MKRHPSFRPSLTILESRWLPTASVYPDVFRNAVQQAYVAQADTATNPVVFLGDSITYNWGSATRPAPGSAAFTADFAGLGAANFGIVGDTTQELLGRVQGGDLNGQPKVAVVMIGFNDLFGGSTPEQAATGVASVVQAIRAESPDTKILLLGVLPSDVTALTPEIRQLDALISGLGSTPNVTYEDPGVLFERANGSANPALLMDLVHPDAAGYRAIADAIDATVLGLLDGIPPMTTAPSTASPGPTSPVQSQPIVDAASPILGSIPTVTSIDISSTSPTTKTGHAHSFATELIDVSTG